MFIKFNFQNQTKKAQLDFSSLDDLKLKFTQLFSNSRANQVDFFYKDEDNELVSIQDQDDWNICLDEAKYYEQKSVTIITKIAQTYKARSASRKNDSSSSDTEGTEEIDMESIEKKEAMQKKREQIKEENAIKIDNLKLTLDEEKKQHLTDLQEGLAKMKAKKEEKLKAIESKIEELKNSSSDDSDIPEDKPWMKHIPKHHREKMGEFRRHHHHPHGHHPGHHHPHGHHPGHHHPHGHHPGHHGKCHQQLHGLISDIKETFKGLKHCGEYLNQVIKVATPAIKDTIKNSIE
jgi:hypothetical protein